VAQHSFSLLRRCNSHSGMADHVAFGARQVSARTEAVSAAFEAHAPGREVNDG
jgi:hypothetical protein